MLKRVLVLIPPLIIYLSMTACAAAPIEEQAATTPPAVQDEGSGTQTAPTDSGTPPQSGSPVAIGPSSDLPTPSTSSQPPLMSVWPLEADLFYLNNAGQVWKQPLLGDESAAAAVTPLDTNVRDFAVAPGGEWLLYRTDSFIGVTSVDGLSGQLVTETGPMTPPAMQVRTLAWSPDASRMAYATPAGFEVYIPGAGPDSGPLVFSINERLVKDLSWSRGSDWLAVWRDDNTIALYHSEPAMQLVFELTPINGYAWLSDGRFTFAPAEGGLAVVNPADLASRVFMVPQDRVVDLIGQRPDGTLAFFGHSESLAQPGYLHLGDPVDLSFHQESGVAVDTGDKVWNPVATRLIMVDPEDATGKTVTLFDPATGSSASFEAAGEPLALDWGDLPPRGVAGMPLPADLYFVAPEAGILQVWRLPRNGEAPQTVTQAEADVVDYGISPDGTQIVYTSGDKIYRKVIGTLDVTEVATLTPQANFATSGGTPSFSPDGRQIAYANVGIYVLNLDTGESRRLIANNIPTDPTREREVVIYSAPEWSPDGKWLMVRAGYYEGFDYALLATDGTTREALFLSTFVADATWVRPDLALIFSGGGAYSTTGLFGIFPGTPPTKTQLLSNPVVDAALRADGRFALLISPGPFGLGPTSVRLYSSNTTGGDVRAESGSFIIGEARLSPAGEIVAGLIQARVGEFGGYSGRLAIANPGTGEVFMIEGVTSVRDLRWAR